MTPKTVTKADSAIERMLMGVYQAMTDRSGTPLRWALLEDTPVGVLGLAESDRGLARVDFVKGEDDFIMNLIRAFGKRPIMRGALDEPRRELERYFKGRDLSFDMPVDLSVMSPFERRVLEVTAKIPAGRVLTYTDVATRAGRPKAVRAAGNAVGHNPVAIVVPCHRVVRTDGTLGGYGGGIHIKQWLLEHEGVLPQRLG